MTTKTNSIKFETFINDTEDNCWNIVCWLTGKRPVFEDMMTRSGWHVEDFEITDILLECDSGPAKGDIHAFKSLALMPDAFKEQDLTSFKEDALSFFVDDWMDCQSKAADVCAYDLTN